MKDLGCRRGGVRQDVPQVAQLLTSLGDLSLGGGTVADLDEDLIALIAIVRKLKEAIR